MDWSNLLTNPATAVFVVAAIAIVVMGVVKVVTVYLRHRERVEMIRRGMHPDVPSAGPESDDI